MLKESDYLKLLHDLKRLSKGIRILMTEVDAKKRELIGGLLFDEAERLHDDLEEIKNTNGNGEK